jgi:glucosylceramidase
MSDPRTRRDFMRLTAAGMAAAAALPAQGAPGGDIRVRVTAGAQRFAEAQPLQWLPAAGPSAGSIVLDPGSAYQEVLGFGAAFTDAACYTFNRLPAAARERLFHELFHPSEMGLGVCRTCIGASDYSTRLYSFDDGEADPELRRFSIAHDRDYILPMLRLGRQVNPGLFLFGSPWSPPGWMKAGGSMLGGSMRKSSFAVYARYLAKFLQAYQAEGVAIDALTSQNEVDTDQDGKMPACLWGQEYEIEFIARHLGPELARSGLAAKIWILDHNYNLWGRALCTLDAPGVGPFVDGVAWHGYGGDPSAMTRVHEAHPDKHAYWTEGGPDYTDPAYLTDWTKWSATFTGILRNWARCIVGWNLALDEKGRPNIGPFSCGGLVAVHSETGEIARSGQYWAFAHYSRAIRRGARRIGSEGAIENLSHAAFANPDGSTVAVLTNAGPARKVRLELAGRMAEVALPADSVVTLEWS